MHDSEVPMPEQPFQPVYQPAYRPEYQPRLPVPQSDPGGWQPAPAPQARSGSHYSVALFLCGGNGAAHPGITRGCNGFNPRRQLLLRTTSISAKQPRGSGIFHSLLEHERTVFHRLPTFLRGGWSNCAVCRSLLQAFPAACGSGSFSAAKPGARSTPMDALQL